MENEVTAQVEPAQVTPPADTTPTPVEPETDLAKQVRKKMGFIGGEFLDSAALPERPGVELTVRSMRKGEVKRPGKKDGEEKWLLVFEEIPEFPMVLGAKCNRKAAMARLGDSSRDWPGKRLTIYRDPGVKFGKDIVGGIRIA